MIFPTLNIFRASKTFFNTVKGLQNRLQCTGTVPPRVSSSEPPRTAHNVVISTKIHSSAPDELADTA